MVAQVQFNPMLTTNAAGTFSIYSDGLYQGVALDDPAVRFQLAGGVLNTTETLPMWGGVGVYEDIPSNNYGTLGGLVGRATALTNLIGFSVFNQAHAGITTPQSPVPLFGSNQTINFYRLGSLARIALKVASSLVSLEGGLITQQVSWDFAGQQLVPYVPAYANATISGFSWASTSGGRVTFTVGTDLTSVLSAGSIIETANIVVTGSPTQSINGQFTVVSVTSSTIVVTAAAAANPFGTYSSGGIVVGGGGALPVKILQLDLSNSKTVSYDPVTGFATWTTNGAVALCLI